MILRLIRTISRAWVVKRELFNSRLLLSYYDAAKRSPKVSQEYKAGLAAKIQQLKDTDTFNRNFIKYLKNNWLELILWPDQKALQKLEKSQTDSASKPSGEKEG